MQKTGLQQPDSLSFWTLRSVSYGLQSHTISQFSKTCNMEWNCLSPSHEVALMKLFERGSALKRTPNGFFFGLSEQTSLLRGRLRISGSSNLCLLSVSSMLLPVYRTFSLFSGDVPSKMVQFHELRGAQLYAGKVFLWIEGGAEVPRWVGTFFWSRFLRISLRW